jgi:hypothetical protein
MVAPCLWLPDDESLLLEFGSSCSRCTLSLIFSIHVADSIGTPLPLHVDVGELRQGFQLERDKVVERLFA